MHQAGLQSSRSSYRSLSVAPAHPPATWLICLVPANTHQLREAGPHGHTLVKSLFLSRSSSFRWLSAKICHHTIQQGRQCSHRTSSRIPRASWSCCCKARATSLLGFLALLESPLPTPTVSKSSSRITYLSPAHLAAPPAPATYLLALHAHLQGSGRVFETCVHGRAVLGRCTGRAVVVWADEVCHLNQGIGLESTGQNTGCIEKAARDCLQRTIRRRRREAFIFEARYWLWLKHRLRAQLQRSAIAITTSTVSQCCFCLSFLQSFVL